MKFNLNKFKEFRIKNCFTQKQIAVLLNTKQNTISTWENGTRKPSDIKIYGMAKKLNTEVSSFTDSEEDVVKEKQKELNPLEEILLRRFRKMDKDAQVFYLEITQEKYQSLLDEIEEYKNIIKKMTDHLGNNAG